MHWTSLNKLLTRVPVIIVLLSIPMAAQATVDPSTVSISADKLKADAQEWPLPLWRNANDIRRAACSRLAQYAYKVYGQVVARHPNDTNALILYGLSAIHYHQTLIDPFVGGGDYSKEIVHEEESAERIALSSLEAALPNDKSGAAHAFLGHYLCNGCVQNPDWKRGSALLREAVRINSKMAGFHASLALALSMSWLPGFDRRKAEQEAHLAMQLDPNLAGPHWTLFLMNLQAKQRHDAIAELKAYVALLPPGAVAQSRSIPLFCRQLGITLDDLTDNPSVVGKQE